MSTAATAPAATAGPPPRTTATAVGHPGRPPCDGTAASGEHHCALLADFTLRRPGEPAVSGYACTGHVGQVATALNSGGSGPAYEHRLIPITSAKE